MKIFSIKSKREATLQSGVVYGRQAILLVFLLMCLIYQTNAQIATSCSSPTVLAGWTTSKIGNRGTNCVGQVLPSGAIAGYIVFDQDKYKYCPDVSAGCGNALLGSKGHGNTRDFSGGICLANFYYCGVNPGWVNTNFTPFDCNSTVFDPLNPVNLYVDYTIPKGKSSCLTSFDLNLINPSVFEKQGVAVYKNGVKIYESVKPTGNAITFPFTGADFCTDGSADVNFRIYFGLVHKIGDGNIGYAKILLKGICGGPIVTAAAKAATCSATGPNADASITLTGFTATQKYAYTAGSTYTGSATYATASAIPANGVIVNTLPDPGTAKTYTIRVFEASGCYQDVTVTLNPAVCTPNCTPPSTVILTINPATCTGTTPNNNASIAVSGVTGGDKVGYSAGATYTGPAYTSATALVGGAYTISNLPNPTGSQTYTVRVFNADNTCFVDKTIVLDENTCTPCKNAVAQIKTSGAVDTDSKVGNGVLGEDDQVSYQTCTTPQNIDLKLTKTVVPNTGTTCPTGTVFTWTLTLTNEGTMAATNIQVADSYPEDMLLLVSATPTSGTFSPGGGWQIASLGAGQSTTLVLTTKALKAGTIKNCAEVQSAFPLNDPDSTPGNGVTTEDDYACASITVTGNNLPTLTKEFSPLQTRPNTPTRLTLKITNNESTPITLTANLIDNLTASPAQMVVAPIPNITTTNGVWVVAVAGASSFYIPSSTVLPPGVTQISLDVVMPIEGTYCNTIAAGALQTTSCSNLVIAGSCVDVKNTNVIPPSVAKTFSTPKLELNQVGYLTITVTNQNAGSLTLTDDFNDNLPQDLVLAAGTNTGTCAGVKPFAAGDNIVTLLAGSVIAPGTCTIIVPVKSSKAGTYCNQIAMNALRTTLNGVDLGNQEYPQACLEVVNTPVFDLALIKQLSATQSRTVTAGSSVTFTVTVMNQGSVDGTNIQVTDYIPTGLTLNDPNWTAVNGKAMLNTPIASLSAGQSVTRNIVFTVTSTAGGSLTNVSEISSASNAQNLQDKDSTPDNDPTNDGTPLDNNASGDHKNNPSQDEDDSDPEVITVTPKACLGDYVWFDTNQNGQQDAGETGVASVTAVLYDAVSGTVVSTMLTDGTGKYQFCNLNPGSYYVKFTAPAGTTFTTPNSGNDATDSDVASTTGTMGTTPVVSLTAGENNPTIDAGLVPLKASLGDYVWYDNNKNGQQDAGEPVAVGVTVTLYDATTNQPLSTMVTDGTGHYLFTNLNPGTYYVVFTAPSGATFTTLNTGSDATDSDAGVGGKTGNYTLVAGQQDLTVDAGLVPQCMSPNCMTITVK